MDDVKNGIYPLGIRQNYNVIFYSDIALRNYVRSKELFKQLDFTGGIAEEDLIFDLFAEHVISTIIFSTMCIEAYLNDYAAACLGDEEFYGYFDKLSIEGKFALIGKFVLLTQIDKSQSYYSRLKCLVRDRNKYTHSKSTAFVEFNKLIDLSELDDEDLSLWEASGIDETPYREMLNAAKNSLLAIRDIALFFDAHDSKADAIARLFCVGSTIPDKHGNDVRSKILHELHIKDVVNR